MAATPKSRNGKNRGVAAMEFAFVLPLLIVLFLVIVNLSQYVTMNRRLAVAANLVADLVTRNREVTGPLLTDYLAAAEIALWPAGTGNLSVSIYNYRKTASGKLDWTKTLGTGAACTAPNATRYATLQGTTDVIVAVVCMPFVPPINMSFLGQNYFTIFPLPRQEAVMRPRASVNLDCTAGCP